MKEHYAAENNNKKSNCTDLKVRVDRYRLVAPKPVSNREDITYQKKKNLKNRENGLESTRTCP